MDEDNPRVYFRLFQIATCFALTGSVASLTVAAGSLVGHAIAANKALATLPLVLKLVGTMTAGFPASLLMRKNKPTQRIHHRNFPWTDRSFEWRLCDPHQPFCTFLRVDLYTWSDDGVQSTLPLCRRRSGRSRF